MKKQIIASFFIAIGLFTGAQAFAQTAKDLRINEIMAVNDSGYVDDFGSRGPWIEIFNSAYNPVNIGGCYITNDTANKKMYRLPTNSPATLIPLRAHLILWADKTSRKGPLHLNFDLSESRMIAIVDANGEDIIDVITFPEPKADISYGREVDGSDVWESIQEPTPNSSNDTKVKISSADRFKKVDPSGIGLTIVAMSVVFTALLVMYLLYRTLGKIYTMDSKKRGLIKKGKIEEAADLPEDISGETNAAIAMALYLYNTELHDFEDTVLTINKVSRNYSPWSSKIYAMRQWPEKRK